MDFGPLSYSTPDLARWISAYTMISGADCMRAAVQDHTKRFRGHFPDAISAQRPMRT